jgi:hypothetical protein
MPLEQSEILVNQLKQYADKCFYISSRKTLFDETRAQRKELHTAISKTFANLPELPAKLGLDPGPRV